MAKIRRAVGVTAIALGLALAGGAQAGIVLSDNFDGETTALNYNSFANWTVSSGTVDLVAHGTFDINCFGGAGKCVDLDGSTGDAGIMSGGSFAFDAGDVVTLTFQARGNDRGGASDTLGAGFNFGGATISGTFFASGGFGPIGGGFVGTALNVFDALAADDPYALYTFSITPSSAGNLFVTFAADGGDNVGPILDNVTLDITSPGEGIPEPATWAMMLLGFGGLGAMLRRRRAAYA